MAAAQRLIQMFQHMFGLWMSGEFGCPVSLASLAITFGGLEVKHWIANGFANEPPSTACHSTAQFGMSASEIAN
jgi:hypothetical protein